MVLLFTGMFMWLNVIRWKYKRFCRNYKTEKQRKEVRAEKEASQTIFRKICLSTVIKFMPFFQKRQL